jgi:hypothetical protein
MSIRAETEKGQKRTPKQQGDDNEIFFQRYIEDVYSDAEPQFIENTKYDSVHGIDKAFVMNDHLHLCIAEVKSQYSQLGKGQMSKQWITERLQKLQQQDLKHPLIIAIKKVLENNGEVYACTYRVNQNNTDKKPVQFTKGNEKFTANELNAILNKSTQLSPINSFSQGKNTMTSIATSSESIAHAIQILTAYAQNLEENYRIHSSQIMHLQSGWADSQHAALSNEFGNLLIPIQQSISRTHELINTLQYLYQAAVDFESQRF